MGNGIGHTNAICWKYCENEKETKEFVDENGCLRSESSPDRIVKSARTEPNTIASICERSILPRGIRSHGMPPSRI